MVGVVVAEVVCVVVCELVGVLRGGEVCSLKIMVRNKLRK